YPVNNNFGYFSLTTTKFEQKKKGSKHWFQAFLNGAPSGTRTLGTLIKHHIHSHTHTIVHTHNGVTHTHVITHKHEHNHLRNEDRHDHKHKDYINSEEHRLAHAKGL
ncbi:MAG: hypothetical protein MSH08_07935, partial [Ezakiella sp.]|nr:hypothetical protein [Ezakiella sp.]